jgi:hypothetical protein
MDEANGAHSRAAAEKMMRNELCGGETREIN